MTGILEYSFMQNAFLAAVLVSVACGVVGTYVVIKRIVFISGGISHAAFGGIGLGYFLGINPILAAIPFSIMSALIMGMTSKKIKISEDTAIGILWSLGMAIGIIFINLTPGYVPDLMSYLFGSILTVPVNDIIIMLFLDLIIIVTVLSFYKEFQSISFDEEFSQVIGMPTTYIYLLLLSIVALSVVVLIKVVGVILVIALLTIPAAIAKQYTYKIGHMMIFAVILGVILTMGGLYVSYLFNLASGATIVLVLGLGFIFSSAIQKLKNSI
ncbi:MAG: metal ABC transporter permease [Euryarchaeota archaeon]|jgi:zinc transport system permease protein|uniref:metal ABC transporter permease n=1 Tax=Methanobacterium sp. MZD130B TaxID=3394378 RepID=UPI001753C964|nr:metal ABC transporter permease [Euryarchaeota archaeon]HHT18753.1 metal ABC transporter permease [Methanobacterium sp.]